MRGRFFVRHNRFHAAGSAAHAEKLALRVAHQAEANGQIFLFNAFERLFQINLYRFIIRAVFRKLFGVLFRFGQKAQLRHAEGQRKDQQHKRRGDRSKHNQLLFHRGFPLLPAIPYTRSNKKV